MSGSFCGREGWQPRGWRFLPHPLRPGYTNYSPVRPKEWIASDECSPGRIAHGNRWRHRRFRILWSHWNQTTTAYGWYCRPGLVSPWLEPPTHWARHLVRCPQSTTYPLTSSGRMSHRTGDRFHRGGSPPLCPAVFPPIPHSWRSPWDRHDVEA